MQPGQHDSHVAIAASGTIIQIVLLAGIAGIAILTVAKRKNLPVHFAVVLAVLGVGALAVVFPDITTALAHVVGVERGADLMLYVVMLGVMFALVHSYTRHAELQRQLDRAIREVALLRDDLETRTRRASSIGLQDRPSTDTWG
ncbi:MAG: DUF2304 domain-containing protein [Kofleriaceae bacterium]